MNLLDIIPAQLQRPAPEPARARRTDASIPTHARTAPTRLHPRRPLEHNAHLLGLFAPLLFRGSLLCSDALPVRHRHVLLRFGRALRAEGRHRQVEGGVAGGAVSGEGSAMRAVGSWEGV